MSSVYAKLDEDIGHDASQALQAEAEATSMILVLGETGAGKSHFINAIAPGTCETSPRLSSCTSKPNAVEVKFDGKPLILIDTPGFNDTRSSLDRSDATILAEIARMIAAQSALGVQMKGIFYLHDINAPRMTGEALRQLTLLQKTCGEDNWKNVSFITTKWPDERTQQKYELGIREGDLRKIYWRPMLRIGSRMYRFEDTAASAQSIVRSMVSQPAVKFALQEEMARTGSLADTSAGKFVIAAREEDEKRYRTVRNPSSQQGMSSQELEQMQESIERRKQSEAVLQENVEEQINSKLQDHVKQEIKTTGKRPSVVSLISILIGLGSFCASIVQAITG